MVDFNQGLSPGRRPAPLSRARRPGPLLVRGADRLRQPRRLRQPDARARHAGPARRELLRAAGHAGALRAGAGDYVMPDLMRIGGGQRLAARGRDRRRGGDRGVDATSIPRSRRTCCGRPRPRTGSSGRTGPTRSWPSRSGSSGGTWSSPTGRAPAWSGTRTPSGGTAGTCDRRQALPPGKEPPRPPSAEIACEKLEPSPWVPPRATLDPAGLARPPRRHERVVGAVRVVRHEVRRRGGEGHEAAVRRDLRGVVAARPVRLPVGRADARPLGPARQPVVPEHVPGRERRLRGGRQLVQLATGPHG